ncbi:maltose O-acetyltransferase-like protein [Pyronema omphalodes]|nr:maltose O-acetyltransferase-like protein [Pyronema omphalodes]
MATEKEKMLRGELYHAFSPDLVSERARCAAACAAFNSASDASRTEKIQLWNAITNTPYKPDIPEDSQPWIEPPFRCDYGYNISLGLNSFINFGCTILDTCKVTIGARTLVGPNVSFYAATHPLDAEVRRGTEGPEMGKEIIVGRGLLDWGVVVAAAAVVTKDVEDFCVVAGNPARVVRRLKGAAEGKEDSNSTKALMKRLETLEAEMAEVKQKLLQREM